MYLLPEGETYLISEKALTDIYNTSASTLRTWRERYGYITKLQDNWFRIDALSRNMRKQIDLTHLQSLQEHKGNTKEVAALKRALQSAYAEYAPYYTKLRDSQALAPEDCTDTAQKWAVWEWITNTYSKQKQTNYKKLHTAYVQLFPNHLTDYKSFNRYKQTCIKMGVEQIILDRRKLGTAIRRISDKQYYFLRNVYMDDRKFSSSEMHIKLIGYCAKIGEEPCSQDRVKQFKREFEKDIECYIARYGMQEAKKRMPKHTSIPALYRLDQVQGDGWTIPLFCSFNDKTGKQVAARPVVFCLMDNHSKKIISYSIGRRENSELIIEALDDMLHKTNALPAEFVFDKHSAQGTPFFKRFARETEKRGTNYHISINPSAKGILERHFTYLDSIIKLDQREYLGKGITAKSKDARRNPETYVELRKPENLLNIHQITSIIAATILRYNSTPLNSLDGKSPNDAYEQSEERHSIALTKGEILDLVKPKQAYKVANAQITIKRGTVRHEFQLPAKLYHLEGEKVNVVYEDLSEGIYLEHEKTGLFEELRPKQKIHGASVNRTAEDEKILNQTKGRQAGYLKQSSRKNKQIEQELISNSPDMLPYLDTYTVSKDMRKELEENSELRLETVNHGGNPDMIPVSNNRHYKPAVVVEKKRVNGKTERRPFGQKNHTIGILKDDDTEDYT